MQLHALHHVAALTGDADAIAEFYADGLGLRIARRDGHQLVVGDEHASPGSLLMWTEEAGVGRGRAGAGMVHRVELGVGGAAALEFWADRLGGLGVATETSAKGLRLRDPDGLELELQGDTHGNPPLRAQHPDVPAEHAVTGVQGARALAADPGGDREMLTGMLGFDHKRDDEYVVGVGDRHSHWGYDPHDAPGEPGAGTVHHVAWLVGDDAEGSGLQTPQGVRFELVTA